MHHISSRQNRFYKEWLRLAQLAGGSRSDYVLLEGVHLSTAWLQHFGAPDAVILDQSQINESTLTELCDTLATDVPIYALSSGLFKGLSDVVNPQGVIFVVPKLSPQALKEINQTCVLLDRVQDPGNLGTILRTVAALGIQHVFLTPGTVSAWSPKVLRSAQGAHFLTNIHEQVDFELWVKGLKIPLALTLLSPQSRSLYDSDLRGPIAWAFGNESQGVNSHWQDVAKHSLVIPHTDQIESLNVSVAAAVCLFEHHRQNLQPLT